MTPDGTLTVTTPSGVTRTTRPPGLDGPAIGGPWPGPAAWLGSEAWPDDPAPF
jgi:hypothetical protein